MYPKCCLNMLKTILRQTVIYRTIINFVPTHEPVTESDVCKLRAFLSCHKDVMVLTGAGISTESGIPDYRSKDVGLYARSNHKPMTYQEFVKSMHGRRKYWARSFVGWPRFSSVIPNVTHEMLQKLEVNGFISSIVTQNVDNLHFKAGCRNVIELHGSLYRVICISCGNYSVDRFLFQNMLAELNPNLKLTSEVLRPDGDVDLAEEDVYSFVIPNCPQCRGFLKPDVIFFGENVPLKRVEKLRHLMDSSSSLLILGSSLSVYSAYRIVLQAAEAKKRICIINIGKTRADNLTDIKIEAKCGEILPAAVSSLLS